MADCIERQAAIDALTERNLVVHMDSVNDGLVASCHRSAQRIIANLPAADVRPVKRGRWIETKTGFHCSAFKTKAKGTKDGALLSNYCPNCGAMMEESR